MSTPRNRLIWLAIISTVILCVSGAVVFVLDTLREHITAENCDRIKEGMTESEVEVILGRPADFHWQATGQTLRERLWGGEKRVIIVQLDESGSVCRKACEGGESVEAFRSISGASAPTAWEKLRMRFGWKRPLVVKHPVVELPW